jgi:tyrosine-protein phosphatase YwqE
MWNPFRKTTTLARSGLLQGLTDWHSHLLPSVDDGITALTDTLRLLRAYEQQGLTDVWFTPHIMEDIPNTTRALQARFAEVQEAYDGPVRLHLAAEYMLDNLFDQRLREGDLLPLGDASHLLVDTSYFSPPMDLDGTLRRIQQAGYHPVLAHPERYVYMSTRDYQSLSERHILFQVNLFSLTGMYGHTAASKASWLVKHGLVDRVGTDTHRVGQFLKGVEEEVETGVVEKLAFKELAR